MHESPKRGEKQSETSRRGFLVGGAAAFAAAAADAAYAKLPVPGSENFEAAQRDAEYRKSIEAVHGERQKFFQFMDEGYKVLTKELSEFFTEGDIDLIAQGIDGYVETELIAGSPNYLDVLTAEGADQRIANFVVKVFPEISKGAMASAFILTAVQKLVALARTRKANSGKK